jgi:glucan 1,6-alpha-isomaltosidase
VTTSDGTRATSTNDEFTYRGAPTVISVSPSSGPAGAAVTLSGSGFGATQGSSYVQFIDGSYSWGAQGKLRASTIASRSNTSISFDVPTPSGPGSVGAVVPGSTASHNGHADPSLCSLA